MIGGVAYSSQGFGSFVLRRAHLDPPLLAGIVGVLMLGAFVLYSASGNDMDLLYRQFIKVGLALAGMLLVLHIFTEVLISNAYFCMLMYHYAMFAAPPVPIKGGGRYKGGERPSVARHSCRIRYRGVVLVAAGMCSPRCDIV